MICSNSIYHTPEYELEYDEKLAKEQREYDDEERAIEEWKLSRED